MLQLEWEKKITWGVVNISIPEQHEILIPQVWWEAGACVWEGTAR